MKIIDEKGRLFEKINIIDLFFLGIILFGVIVYFPRAKIFQKFKNSVKVEERKSGSSTSLKTKKATGEEAGLATGKQEGKKAEKDVKEIDLYVIVRFPGYIAEVADVVSAGDTTIDKLQAKLVKVLKIKSSRYAGREEVLGRNLKDITAKILIKAQKTGDLFIYDGEYLKIGGSFLFKSALYDINGEVLKIIPVNK
ncbi:MAG: hypothetical protein DRP74_03560 [Candidatus Omnitrophota bacterium]|nr:MAG: hypothetical protein DRP74_03560 [Candidatus Omnitrophota bacterium]